MGPLYGSVRLPGRDEQQPRVGDVGGEAGGYRSAAAFLAAKNLLGVRLGDGEGKHSIGIGRSPLIVWFRRAGGSYPGRNAIQSDAMDASTIVAGFLQAVGEISAELKAQTLEQIDIDLLKLKRRTLTQKLEDFKKDLADKVTQEKGRVEQDMISRGLGNTSIRLGQLANIDQQANTQSERAVREYNLAIAEIALLERRLREQSNSWWNRLIRKVFRGHKVF